MKDLIVLDTETTGVEAKRDSIIEIAAARVSNGKIVEQFQTLVKPVNPLNVTVSVLTGIQPEELENAPSIQEIGPKLLEFVGDLPIVGHNISFDTDFLKSHGIDPPGHSLDTLDLAITLLPKVPFHSMQYLSKYLELQNQPSHRAMSDVLATIDLINTLVSLAKNIPADILKNIRELSTKSDWEWSWVFDEKSSWQSSAPLRHPELDSGSPSQRHKIPDQVRNDGKEVSLGEIKPGFNVYELPPGMPQMATNFALVANPPDGGENSILVVSNDVFQKNDWSQLGLHPHFGSVLQLDAERFNFLINKPKLRSTEFKLLVKILLTGYPEKPFNPADTYLTKDEFYLWEQKLAPLQFRIPVSVSASVRHAELDSASPGEILNPNLASSQSVQDDGGVPRGGWVGLPPKTVMSFASFYEILDNNPDILKDKHIYLSQWIEFDEWATNKSAKMFTALYVNAIVASRRDFVHDFVTDNKVADDLFKLLNNLGSELNDWWASVEELWGEQASGSALEISGLLVADKTGKSVMTKAKVVAETLNIYLEKIKSISFTNQPAQQKQVEHTTNLLEHFHLLTHPGQSAKNYLNGYNDRVILNVVKQPVANIWQTPVPRGVQGAAHLNGKATTLPPASAGQAILPLVRGGVGGVGLKGLTVIIISNGVLVNSKPDFISSLLGEPISVTSIPVSSQTGLPRAKSGSGIQAWIPDQVGNDKLNDLAKPITFVSGLPDRNHDDNYQSEIFEYLIKKIINPNEKILIVFPNVAMMAEFFEANYDSLSREARYSLSATAGHPETPSVIPSGVEGSHINLFSQNVAGNVEMLQDKLSALDGFTLLISGTNLAKFLGVLDGLDKTVFLTMPFDIPGSLSGVLAKDRFRNEFADYGLPKAIVKFKVNLAELYSKTKEIWILDSRLISTDWGQTVPKSLSGFQIISTPRV